MQSPVKKTLRNFSIFSVCFSSAAAWLRLHCLCCSFSHLLCAYYSAAQQSRWLKVKYRDAPSLVDGGVLCQRRTVSPAPGAFTQDC